ncbi:MAG: Ferric uptake regulation protein [Planctomycetes bacterium]|nr:Ferric uptake regulation protein [Planctomycetota bacterium]
MDDFEKVHGYLRGRGLRRTDARRSIVDGALRADGHYTADELLEKLRASGERVSRASVYRTLALLVEGGFVETREFRRGQTMFEPVLGRHHHDHLICTGCGAIVEFENDEIERLQEETARKHGFRLERHSLRLYGRCATCLSA